MKYPINYDFGKHWNTKIKPLLDLPRVQKSLEKGINDYLSRGLSGKKYKKNTCPANYSSDNCYAQLMMRKRENILERLEEEGKLPERYLELKNTNLEEEDDYEDLTEEYWDLEQEILKPYFEWNIIKYDLETYYIHNSCHWTNPTFGLTLAKLVEPNEKWMVRRGDEHTTVINKEKTKVFDILYWGIDDRLENHIFGDVIEKEDKTLGGKEAYLNSVP
jgi:hypothetical protein